MDYETRFIVQSNIKRYSGLLQGPLDAATRTTVEALLTAARRELAEGLAAV